MIIGSGLIASAFIEYDRENIILFASGVSYSLESKKEEFQREEKLILKTIQEYPEKLFIYFSTCSIYDSSKNNSLYVNHKLKMEAIIAAQADKYVILRVSNAVGKGGNPNTLINFIFQNIIQQKQFTLHQKATRNIIAIHDIVKITLNIIDKKAYNTIINLATPTNYYIIELVKSIEEYTNLKADYSEENCGEDYTISIDLISHFFIDFNKKNYLENILKLYY